MLAAAATYTLIAIGALALFTIGVGIIYHRHRKDVKARHTMQQEMEQAVRDRMQHVTDMNLPPFYIDHELDPVCIYEDELPPGAAAPIQPILVHSSSHQEELILIPPEEDPLVAAATSPSLRRGLSADSANELATNHHESASEVMATHISALSPAQPSLNQVILRENFMDRADSSPAIPQLPNHGLGIDLAHLPPAATGSFSSVSSVHSPSTTAGSLAPSSPPQQQYPGTPPTPARFLSAEMINMARLRAPPSYDVPNVVVDRSPSIESPPQLHLRPSHQLRHMNSHPHPLHISTSPVDSHSPIVPQNDYFGQQHARSRSHTFSHPAPQPSSTPGEALVETPRYSLEFPSHIPHEIHLERHQVARAMFMSQSPSTTPALPPQQGLLSSPAPLSLDSFSVTISTGHSEGEQQPQQVAGTGPRTRPRASTLGESSKLLIQRVQTLWRARASSSSASSSASSSPALQSSSQFVRGHYRQSSFQEMHSTAHQSPLSGMANIINMASHEEGMATATAIETSSEREREEAAAEAVEEPGEEMESIEQPTTTTAVSVAAAAPPAAPSEPCSSMAVVETQMQQVKDEQVKQVNMDPEDNPRGSLDSIHTFAVDSMPMAAMPSLLAVS